MVEVILGAIAVIAAYLLGRWMEARYFEPEVRMLNDIIRKTHEAHHSALARLMVLAKARDGKEAYAIESAAKPPVFTPQSQGLSEDERMAVELDGEQEKHEADILEELGLVDERTRRRDRDPWELP